MPIASLNTYRSADPNKPVKITGLRPGEKLLESLINESQSARIKQCGKYTHHFQIMGYNHRMNFGIQQGLIELNQQLCEADLCHICPFLQIESRSYN